MEIQAFIDGVYWEGSANGLMRLLQARQKIDEERESACSDCGGVGLVLQGQYDDIREVECICVKQALADAESNLRNE